MLFLLGSVVFPVFDIKFLILAIVFIVSMDKCCVCSEDYNFGSTGRVLILCVCMGVCVYIDVCLYGCVSLWMCVCMDVCLYGYVCTLCIGI